jgi:hypothetical protein
MCIDKMINNEGEVLVNIVIILGTMVLQQYECHYLKYSDISKRVIVKQFII